MILQAKMTENTAYKSPDWIDLVFILFGSKF